MENGGGHSRPWPPAPPRRAKTLPASNGPVTPQFHRAQPAPPDGLGPITLLPSAARPSVFPPVPGHDKKGRVRCISGGKVRAGRLACAGSRRLERRGGLPANVGLARKG